MKIPVVLISDEDTMFSVASTMISLLENTSKKNKILFNIIHTGDVSKQSIEKIKSIEKMYSNANINFIDMGDKYKNEKKTSERIHYACLYKMCIAELLPQFNKVIYLDTDLIVRHDIAELYNIDLGDNYIGGVFSFYHYLHNRYLIDWLRIPNLDTYINAGVLSMNLEKIRKDNMEKKLQYYIGTFPESLDQHIMNMVYYRKIKLLPPKWNLTIGMITCWGAVDYFYPPMESQAVIQNPAIVHFAGKMKPWKYFNVFLGFEWLRYHKMSPFNDMEFNLVDFRNNPWEVSIPQSPPPGEPTYPEKPINEYIKI